MIYLTTSDLLFASWFAAGANPGFLGRGLIYKGGINLLNLLVYLLFLLKNLHEKKFVSKGGGGVEGAPPLQIVSCL